MTFYAVEPEVPGQFGEDAVVDYSTRPVGVSQYHLEFDGWLGDDLVEAIGTFLVTEPVASAISQSDLTGVEFAEAKVTPGTTLQELQPDLELPTFRWMKVTGEVFRDDFGISEDIRLVVSDRAWELLQRHAKLDFATAERLR